jgi:hypothetical protein
MVSYEVQSTSNQDCAKILNPKTLPFFISVVLQNSNGSFVSFIGRACLQKRLHILVGVGFEHKILAQT